MDLASLPFGVEELCPILSLLPEELEQEVMVAQKEFKNSLLKAIDQSDKFFSKVA
jgi:hypothetical protein